MSLITKLVGFLVLAVALSFSAPASAQKGTIKIAVQAPLSGEQAAIGDSIKLGAQLAVEESVQAGGWSRQCAQHCRRSQYLDTGRPLQLRRRASGIRSLQRRHAGDDLA